MKITIEQYIEQCFTMRCPSKVDLSYIHEKEVKHNIKVIHAEVSNRMKFSIPVYYINSYDVNSCIVSLDTNQWSHIIDIAMFWYFQQIFNSLYTDSPNYGVFTYRQLRHDICLSKSNDREASYYRPDKIFVNEHDIMDNMLPCKYTEKQIEEYMCMVRFYFLHEYSHYLMANPLREASNDLADAIVEIFFDNVSTNNNPIFCTELGKELQKAMVKAFYDEWHNSQDFREEVYCDLQALLCLLELPGAYKKITVEMILDAVMSFMYIQHVIWSAKHIDEPIKIGNQFAFRQNVIATLAWLMEDEKFSGLLCQLLHKGNRFFIPAELKIKPMLWQKQQNFYSYFIEMLLADKKKEIRNGKYIFPMFLQSEYVFSSEYRNQAGIPPWFAIPEP